MAMFKPRRSKTYRFLQKSEIEARGGEVVFWGCGIIIECEQQQDDDLATSSYISTIICPATLFVRTDAIQPPDIKVDVYLWNAKLCKGQVVAWDFHYNLAAVRVQSDYPLPTATLRGLDDVVSILPTNHDRSRLPHSNLFKIISWDQGRLRPMSRWIVMSSIGQYRRPWLGVEIANLYSCSSDFLGEIMRKFPNVSGGVVVTKVADSPAYCSGICPKDVIVKCDGIVVRSMLEFFDIVWNKGGGESAELNILRASDAEILKICLAVEETTPDNLNILRASDAEILKICLAVEETTPDKFYQWRRTFWAVIPRDQ